MANLLIRIIYMLLITDLLSGMAGLNQTVNCEINGTVASTLTGYTYVSSRNLTEISNNHSHDYQLTKLNPSSNTKLKSHSIAARTTNGTKVVIEAHLSNENRTKEISKVTITKSLKSLNTTLQAADNNSKNKNKLSTKTVPTKVSTDAACSKMKNDTLVLSLNWPVNICSKRACILNSPQRWFIHNLGYTNLPNHCCSKRAFKISELGPEITNELKEHMQSVLATKPDESVWFEGWTNFGTCFDSNEKLNTIHKYFNETLHLFKKIDLDKWLIAKNITPLDDINKGYDFKAFYQAIFEKRPYRFQVVCNTLLNNETMISIIDYVNFCLDNNLSKTNCPKHLESNCAQKVIFPSLDAIESIIQERRKRNHQTPLSDDWNQASKWKTLQNMNESSSIVHTRKQTKIVDITGGGENRSRISMRHSLMDKNQKLNLKSFMVNV